MYKWLDYFKFECFLEKMDIVFRYVFERGMFFGLIFKKKINNKKDSIFYWYLKR